MNKELELKLVDILSGIQTGVERTSDFAMTQLPDIAQQYILYGLVSSWAMLLLWIAIFYVCMKSVRFAVGNENHDLAAPAFVFGAFGVFIAAVCGITTIESALLVTFAPKVWLIKELAYLIK